MDTTSELNHEEVFLRAWDEPTNTRFELPANNVNQVLAEHYETSEPVTFTRDMLWDMEVRKAWRPDIYIAGGVMEESANTWGQRSAADGMESFLRSSMQRLRLNPSEFGLVLERVCLNPAEQRALFIGVAELTGPDGNTLHADERQSQFYVEHSVGGKDSQPLNQWRTVFLTDGPDERLAKPFKNLANEVWLPVFLEVYIRIHLNIELTRRE